jgi:hydroxymethylpyrimidine pyrophosphatase-like HAD family hydrolase
VADSTARRLPSAGPFRALAVDVDGTLVDDTLEIRPRNLDALQRVIAGGCRVIIATGRMYRSALKYAEAIGTDEPLICYQGAVVQSRAGEILREWPVAPAEAVAALEMARSEDLHINLYRDDVFYVERMGPGARRYAEVAQMEPQLVPDLMVLAQQGSTKIVLVDTPERLRELAPLVRRTVEPRARVTFSRR